MTTTIKYIIFFVLFTAVISLFLPVVTELPFGIEGHLTTAVEMFRSLMIACPFFETPYQIFRLSMLLLFGVLMFKISMLFITRGNSGLHI